MHLSIGFVMFLIAITNDFIINVGSISCIYKKPGGGFPLPKHKNPIKNAIQDFYSTKNTL